MNIVHSNAKTDAHNGWFKKRKSLLDTDTPVLQLSAPPLLSLSRSLAPSFSPSLFPSPRVCHWFLFVSLSLTQTQSFSLSLGREAEYSLREKNSIGAECMMKCSIFHDLPYFRSPRRIRQLIEIHVRKFKKNVEIVEAVFIR